MCCGNRAMCNQNSKTRVESSRANVETKDEYRNYHNNRSECEHNDGLKRRVSVGEAKVSQPTAHKDEDACMNVLATRPRLWSSKYTGLTARPGCIGCIKNA
jgi:hypothetical protein